ncbi:MAG: cupredoxin domain-containing protein [Acidobacteriota bacterium]
MNYRMKAYQILSVIVIAGVVVLSLACNSQSMPPVNKQSVVEPAANKKIIKANNSEPDKYDIELTAEPGEIKSDQPVKLTFSIKDPAGKQHPTLDIVHEKKIHLLIVSSDLAYYTHVHPEENSDGTYTVETKFPTAGQYKLYTDYTPNGANQQIGRLDLDVTGTARQHKPLIVDTQETKSFDDVRVTFKPDKPLKVGELNKLNFTFADAKTGKPLYDLEPYLGAMAHFVIISEDTKEFLHAHPLEKSDAAHSHNDNTKPHTHTAPPRQGGPEVSAHTTFPKPGLYKMWTQFQRNGKVITADFVVNVDVDEAKTDAVAAKLEDGIQKIKITVSENGYEPASFQLKRGIPAQITFYRADANNCGEELIFKDLNIYQTLPVNKPVTINLKPEQSATYTFNCGMNMLQGKMIVTN